MTFAPTLIDALAELIAPTRCAGCERQGVLFCPACLATLPRDYQPDQVCPVCAAPFGALACTECWRDDFAFTRTVALGILDGPLARAVVLLKDANEQRLADVLGTLLGERVHECWGSWAGTVTWIPASRAAIQRRGFDHAELIARAVAKVLNVSATPLLQRPRSRDQRGLSRRQRLTGAQQFTTGMDTLPRHILLVDDVFTTGATAHTATEALLTAGAIEVRLGVLARAW